MTELMQKVDDLNGLILQGRALEAFEKYYHKDVVMQENEDSPVIGKEANRQREIAFMNATEFRKARPLKVAIGENISMVQWHFDYTHKEWGEKNYTQVSVQEWKDGQIIKEQFFYKG